MIYLLFAGCFGLSWPSFKPTRGKACGWTVGRHVELGCLSMLEIEGIELLSNAFEDNSALQSLLTTLSFILSGSSLLLLGLLRTNDSLVSQRRLEAFQLRSGHDDCGPAKSKRVAWLI
jgi:hypothetical protein